MSITIKVDDGDCIVDAAGRYVVVHGLEKCAQEIAESLLNTHDPQFPTYYNGSTLWMLYEKVPLLADFSVDEMIRSSVTDSINRLMDMQEYDDYIEDEEKIDRISALFVRSTGDLSWAFFLKCVTDSENYVEKTFDLALRQMLPPGLSDYNPAMTLALSPSAEQSPFL